MNKTDTAGLTDRRFKYKSGADVMSTWRKYGFVPPSQTREDYLFKTNREDLEAADDKA